ncbi:MAG: SRPBCC family protein [Armatimonadetes bacterium]|nr:SRPBCC family protein [Akkermansiaceae bacterium]
MIHTFEQSQFLPITPDAAWDFFSSPRNLDEITPDDLGFKIVYQPGEEMYEGQIIEYRVMVAPGIWVPWVTEIKMVREGESFIDEQRFGPYKFWHHLHSFAPAEGGVMMRDLVHYALPFGPFGAIAHGVFVRKKLERIFGFRKEVLEKRFPKRMDAEDAREVDAVGKFCNRFH